MKARHAQSHGTTERGIEPRAPAVPWLRREPVLASTLAAAAAPLAALVVELARSDTNSTAAIALGAAAAILNALGLAARRAVTPTSAPRLAAGRRLVPESRDQDEED